MTERSAAALAPQEPAQAREQIREQVRRDVEQALREAREAQRGVEDAMQAQGAEAPVIEVPAPPRPPAIRIRRPDGPGVVFTGTGQPFPAGFQDIPPGVQEVTLAFFFTVAAIFIGTPLARAFARRIDRRSTLAAPAGSPDVTSRLDRIEHAVDAIALEVERISEGQRYVTKVMAEGPRALGGPNDAAEHERRLAERALADRAGPQRVP